MNRCHDQCCLTRLWPCQSYQMVLNVELLALWWGESIFTWLFSIVLKLTRCCFYAYLLFCIMLPLCTITMLFAITYFYRMYDISSLWKRHLEIANLSNTWNRKYHHLMQHDYAYLMQKQNLVDYCKYINFLLCCFFFHYIWCTNADTACLAWNL